MPALEITVEPPILEALLPAFLANRVEAALVQGRGPVGVVVLLFALLAM